MPNRVIKDKIWSSPSLAKMSEMAQDHWPRWLLMADDWGCFNSDTDIINGLIYPKRPKITPIKIDKLKQEYYDNGKLFLWIEDDREWGYFTSWDGHQFCNATHLEDDSKTQKRHKRKTPEPLKEELKEYLEKHRLVIKLERPRADADKYRIPIPIPNHNHKPSMGLFDTFWKEYPNKQNKAKAKIAWEKLQPDDQLLKTILSVIDTAKKSENWKDPQYIPHPTTWLNGKRWEDEYTPLKKGSKSGTSEANQKYD